MIEDKFEKKWREMFPENLRVAGNTVKQQSETLHTSTYDQIPRTSGNINFSVLFKALKEDDKKVHCRA